jgi:serine/threonine protein kinase
MPEVPVLIKAIRYRSAASESWTAEEWTEGIELARRQLHHEARTCQRLGRFLGNVPQVLDFFIDKTHDRFIEQRAPWAAADEPYLVLKGIATSNLKAYNQRPDDWILRTATRLARTLREVHRRRYLYGDLKPRNVLIDPWGIAVHLVDFGATTAFLDDGQLDRRSPGFGNMTPGYQGPEFGELWERTDSRFDLYGLGATLFWAQSGEICTYAFRCQSCGQTLMHWDRD